MPSGEKNLERILKARQSTRNFAEEFPPEDDVRKILQAGMLAPYGGATGIPLEQIRKLFVFRQQTDGMAQARAILREQLQANAKKLNHMLRFLPFLRKKMGPFASKVRALAHSGIPALSAAPYLVVIAEKRGFPPVEKQSMAHALQNMWLSATDLGLGFQMLSAVSTLTGNERFLRLLNLDKGEYALDGCVFGYPKSVAERDRELDIKPFVTWIK